MSLVDLSDPTQYAEAIRDGTIWYAPGTIISKYIADINAGRQPVPAYVPADYRAYINAPGADAAPEVPDMAGVVGGE